MIYFFVTSEHAYTFDDIPDATKSRIKIIPYEKKESLRDQVLGPLVFTDLDRLGKTALEEVKSFSNSIVSKHPHIPIHNDPNNVLLRYELLKKLHAEGINHFDIARATDDCQHVRFPVFVRSEHVHSYRSGLGLAKNYEELQRNIGKHQAAGYPIDRMIVTEFCDVSDAQKVFNKYAAYYINGVVIPRHLYFSRNWFVAAKSVRESEDINSSRIGEHVAYVEENTHEAWIKRIFKLAGTDYGRLDYGKKGEDLQVWEINLNPNFSTNVVDNPESGSLDEKRKSLFHLFNERFIEALFSMDDESLDQETFQF